MKTKILELIDKKIEEWTVIGNVSYSSVQELRQEIEAMREEHQWIPVTERLPETKGRYTVFVEGTVATLWYVDDYWYTALFGKQLNVTHWMLLPPHP